MNDQGQDIRNEQSREICWDKYIRGELCEQQARQAEVLLLHDDEALAAYMAALAEHEQELPGLQQEEAFIEAVMRKTSIHGDAQPVRESAEPLIRKKGLREHPLFNYVIAASITLFLLSLGAFDHLSSGTEHILPPSTKPSVSKQIMDRTAGWIDHLKP
ncbi:hypothetical protein [Paenibacillus woosongensis]|uniref:Uncharacterized protein n=1 Tax=Paenibacillus woosongensis TaxID=307580 RepID=A0A7X3CMZ2_9BACL|nr:hypothetical protein [Paenibacillus woosongensis]MUG44637.1 hypothetical protein [Paenibacillus woosongensis]